MKRIIIFFLCVALDVEISFYAVQSCPTCVGKISEESPPFFTDECYQASFDNNLDLDFKQTGTGTS
jgi:hypothetical protein